MNESKHTPGPFTKEPRKCGLGCCDDLYEIMAKHPTEDCSFNRPIATVNGGNAVWLREGEAAANADLFVAAPDLLAACKTVLAHVEDENVERVNNQCTLCFSHRALLREAIAKAEGNA